MRISKYNVKMTDHSNSAKPSIPSDVPEHIAKCINVSAFTTFFASEPDSLGLILKGHHAIETFLNASLIEALYESDALELSRITFLLKTDLLIALSLIPRKVRPLFNRLNSYRNKFAHDPHHIIDEAYSEETSKLLQSLAPLAFKIFTDQDDPDQIKLIPERRLVFICWAACMHTLTAACKRNIAGDVSGRAIEKMTAVKDVESIGKHWMQCEAELLMERYPTFFSEWPTHSNKGSDANSSGT